MIVPREIRLKDGRIAQLREALEEDAAEILKLAMFLRREGTTSRSTPEERDMPVSEQARILREMHENPSALQLLVEVEGKLAGNIEFHPFPKKRVAHIGEFGLGMYPEFRGLGIGKVLLEELISWAKGNPEIEKIGLSVFSDNPAAIALYEKLGFREEGRLFRHVKFEDGHYVDEVKMGLWLGSEA